MSHKAEAEFTLKHFASILIGMEKISWIKNEIISEKLEEILTNSRKLFYLKFLKTFYNENSFYLRLGVFNFFGNWGCSVLNLGQRSKG